MKESGAKADVDRPLLNMDINIWIEMIEFKIFPYYGPIEKKENLVLWIDTILVQSKYLPLEILKIWNKIVLGNEEGLNIVVGAIVLKRTWIEDENIIVSQDEPRLDQEPESEEDDENYREQSVILQIKDILVELGEEDCVDPED